MPPPINIQNLAAEMNRSLASLSRQLTQVQRKAYALDWEARLARAGRKPALPIEFRAQYGEDLLIADLLADQQEGYFIEVGAFDGFTYSTTYALEAFGWSGLLIEGIPERAAECARRRPRSRVVHAALSRRGSAGTTKFNVTDDEYGGMLSSLQSAVPRQQGPRPPSRLVDVPVTSLDDCLAADPPAGGIDVAVIDVEGAEVELLEGFDLLKWKPKILLIEDNDLGRDPRLSRHMATVPYAHVTWVSMSRVYVRADLTDIQLRAGDLR